MKSFDGLQLISTRWGAGDHEIRNFLSRNLVPFQWLDPEKNPECLQMLCDRNIGDGKLPVVLFPDGTSLVQPDTTALASKLPGMRTQSAADHYDVVVAGAGPAGLAAAVYGASEGLRTLVIDSLAPWRASRVVVQNRELPRLRAGHQRRATRAAGLHPGAAARRGVHHAARLLHRDRQRLSPHQDGRRPRSHLPRLHHRHRRRLREARHPGEQQFSGAGLFYGAALTEAAGCANQEVYIVGGANSAGQAAMYFSRAATHVRMLVRGESLERSMSRYLIEQIDATPNISVETHTQVKELKGNGHLQEIVLDTPNGKQTRPASSVFVFIGAAPKT